MGRAQVAKRIDKERRGIARQKPHTAERKRRHCFFRNLALIVRATVLLNNFLFAVRKPPVPLGGKVVVLRAPDSSVPIAADLVRVLQSIGANPTEQPTEE